MTKTYTKVPIGEGTRHRVVLTDLPSQGAEVLARQFKFLQELVNDGVYQGLLHCGPIPFTTFKMHHDGAAWVVVLEAVDQEVDITL